MRNVSFTLLKQMINTAQDKVEEMSTAVINLATDNKTPYFRSARVISAAEVKIIDLATKAVVKQYDVDPSWSQILYLLLRLAWNDVQSLESDLTNEQKSEVQQVKELLNWVKEELRLETKEGQYAQN